MKVNTDAIILARSMKRTTEKLGTAQAQVASGLQNPDPAKDPFASTISKKLSTDVSTATHVQGIVSGAKNIIKLALTNLRSSTDLLNTMKATAIRVNSNITPPNIRADMDTLFQQKISQLETNARSTWGSRTLFDGTFFMPCQTDIQITQASVTSSTTNTLSATDLAINGVAVSAVASGSAKAIASAINAITGSTHVTASATNNITGNGIFSAVPVSNAKIVINGTQVAIGALTGTESADQTVDKTVAAINGNGTLSGLGISASNAGSQLRITASDGSDLTIAYMGGIVANNVAGPAVGTYHGTLALSSMYKIVIGGPVPENAGLTAGTTLPTGITTITLGDMTATTILGALDVTSQTNAQAAIEAIDVALSIISNENNRLMMYGTEFDYVSDSMEATNIDLQEALSGYNDADFATVVRDSERLSLLQDAGMAVLRNKSKEFDKLSQLIGEMLRRG